MGTLYPVPGAATSGATRPPVFLRVPWMRAAPNHYGRLRRCLHPFLHGGFEVSPSRGRVTSDNCLFAATSGSLALRPTSRNTVGLTQPVARTCVRPLLRSPTGNCCDRLLTPAGDTEVFHGTRRVGRGPQALTGVLPATTPSSNRTCGTTAYGSPTPFSSGFRGASQHQTV